MKTWQKYLVGALFALGILSRLWGLGDKAFHHDESIHCFYSYEMATEGRFKGANNNEVTFGYNPVYHGPFLYHFSALILFIFGDSDFTARLPFALMGIFLLWLVWECRKLVGVPMAIGMLAAVTLSPIVNYYSRFAREDVNIGTAFFAVPVFAALFLKTKRTGYLVLTALSLVIGYSMKESSYMYGFALGFFAVAWGLYRWLRYGKEEFRSWFGAPYPFIVLLLLYGCFSVFVFTFVAVDYWVNPKEHGFIGGLFDIASNAFSFEERELKGPELRKKMEAQTRFFTDQARGGAKSVYILLSFVLSGVLFAGLEYLRLKRLPPKPSPDKNAQESSPPQGIAGFAPGMIPLIGMTALWVLMAALLFIGREIVPFLLAVLCWIGLEMVRCRFLRLDRDDPGAPMLIRTAAPWTALASCLGVILLVYVFLFSQMFADWPGLKRGIYDYIEYWFGHQLGEYRLFGPKWYYLARLIIYEFAFLIVATVGVIVALVAVALKKWVKEAEFLTKEIELPGPFSPFFALLIWLAFFNTLIYALLHEKGPWLAFHQAVPWAAVAGGILGWGLSVWRNRWFQMLLALTVGPLALLTLKAHIQVNHNWADNTAELVSQQQADRDIRALVKLVNDKAAETGLFEEFPIASEDEVEWPFPWYFRHYTKYRVKTVDPNAMVQFGDDKTFTEVRAKLGEKFFYRKYLHRGAWVENSMDEGDFPGGESFWANVGAYLRNEKFKNKPFRLLFWNYFFHRERWSDINPKWGYVYIRKEMLPTVEAIAPIPGTFEPSRFLSPDIRLPAPIGDSTPFRTPRGLRFDRQGRLHVVDSLNGRVVVLSATGAFIRSYGGAEAGQGRLTVDPRFGGASTIAIDSEGNSYVADTWGHRVTKFGPDGKWLLAWGQEGFDALPANRFYGPRGIEVGPDGNIYVADTGPCQIAIFKPDGSIVRQFGQKGIRRGDLDEPVGLRFASNGTLYVCDTGNDRIQLLTSEGLSTATWGVPGWSDDKVGMEPNVDLLPDGSVMITLSKKNKIRVFSPDGKTARNFEIAGIKAEPIGVAVAPDGKVWFSDRTTNSLYRVSLPE
ncbi:MAG: TIGR03663 family protein [Candidatus Omnitrophica bacterium]|nr:TIGR03663 family protein [Candidatus Omnitrophota bacterium]